MQSKDEFPQIKRELIDRIEKIEDFIKESAARREEYQRIMKNIDVKLNGDYLIYPPLRGHEQRILDLEKVESERIKTRDWAVKTATGSITIAVGGAVIWIFNVLKDAFIKH